MGNDSVESESAGETGDLGEKQKGDDREDLGRDNQEIGVEGVEPEAFETKFWLILEGISVEC